VNTPDLKKARIEIGLFYMLLVMLIPRNFMVFDFEYWTEWALQVHRYGVTNVYDNPTANYHPLYYYFLWIYDKIQGNEYFITENINFIKFFPMFFDMLPVIVLCCFRQNLIPEKIPYMYLLLNIAYLFNSCVWGQIDSIYASLAFLALITGFTRPVLSALLFALALALKPQPIVYIPLLLLVWLYSVRNIKTVLLMLLMIAGTEFLMALPFIIVGKFDGLWHIVSTAVGRYPQVSIGAFNIWYLIMKDNPYFTPDNLTYFILTYKQVGLLLFLISSGLVIAPLLFKTVRLRLTNMAPEKDLMQMLLLVCGLVSLYFFFFNTQMHERYAHPIVIFFFFYSVLAKDYKLYILASIPYFLSLDKLFPDFLPVQHFKIIWASKVIAIWYLLATAYGTYEFFKQYNIKREWQLLLAEWKQNRSVAR
jgi:Gpi18-like mannosyltransferase